MSTTTTALKDFPLLADNLSHKAQPNVCKFYTSGDPTDPKPD